MKARKRQLKVKEFIVVWTLILSMVIQLLPMQQGVVQADGAMA